MRIRGDDISYEFDLRLRMFDACVAGANDECTRDDILVY